jgi:hypothetical protein
MYSCLDCLFCTWSEYPDPLYCKCAISDKVILDDDEEISDTEICAEYREREEEQEEEVPFDDIIPF